eukprot:gene11819-5150_t
MSSEEIQNVEEVQNNDDFFNDAIAMDEPKKKEKKGFGAALQASRNFDYRKYEHFIYSILITLLSLCLFLFSLSTFIYHVVGIVTKTKGRTVVYWVITLIGDCLGMVSGGFGIVTIVFYKFPKLRFGLINIFAASFLIYVTYMLIASIYGYLFYAEVSMTTPWIVTVIAVNGVFQFLVIWFLFHICWSVKEQMEQERVPGVEYSNLPQDVDSD